MQKASEIIAIGAILLSASQFASAQTSPGQTQPTAEKSSALRDELKDALQQAGFKNIRIISESFLVRALDQNGDPIVMVVRPDSLKTVRAPSDEGEANAEDPGYPDQWGDLSEDEEQATTPPPPNGRIGKLSKLNDRPPAAESDRQAQTGQNTGNGSANEVENDTAQNTAGDSAKSAKMTDQQKNSGAAEQAEVNQAPSQSAKMRDGSQDRSRS